MMYGDVSENNNSNLSPDAFLSSNLGSMIDINPLSIFMHEMEEGGGEKSKLEEELNGRHVENGIINSTEENIIDDDVAEHRPEEKKRKYRHTPLQISEMEGLFKECPNPDVNQQLELSKKLGLDPHQISVWFQNRRRSIKLHQGKTETAMLKAENENLKNEVLKLQAALKNMTCPSCGGDFILGKMSDGIQHLLLESACIKNKVETLVSCINGASGNTNQVHMQSQSLMLPSLGNDFNMYSTYFSNNQ